MARPACFLTTPTSKTRSARRFSKSSNLVSISSIRFRICSSDNLDFSIFVVLARILYIALSGVRLFGGSHRQRNLPKLGSVWEFIQSSETKMFHEVMGRLVKERTPWNLSSSRNFYQPGIQQLLKHSVNGHATNCFNVGLSNWLAVRNDCQGFKRGRTKSRGSEFRKKLAYPDLEFAAADEKPTRDLLNELKGAPQIGVLFLEQMQRFVNFGLGRLAELCLRNLLRIFRSRSQCGLDLFWCERFLRSKEQGLYHCLEGNHGSSTRLAWIRFDKMA